MLYHEILSFSKGHRLTEQELVRSVTDIGQEYLRQRAPDQLAFGAVHRDTDHIHLHLMISANEAGKSERVRLSKKDFANIQKAVEGYVLQHYAELGQTRIYDKARSTERLKTQIHEQAMKARTGAQSRKEALKAQLHQLFERACSPVELETLLKDAGMTPYIRGKNRGVVVRDAHGQERKHRFATLGVDVHYLATVERFGQEKVEPSSPLDQEAHVKPRNPTVNIPADWTDTGPSAIEVVESEFITGKLHPEWHGSSKEKDSDDAPPQNQLYTDSVLQGIERKERSMSRDPAPPTSARDDDNERWGSCILLPGEDILFTSLNMNSKQAKAEPLPEFLGRLGYLPTSIRGHDVWYRSPFRPSERTPSFKVDRQKNVWFDHGMGAGGTIIDLMMHLDGEMDIGRVLGRIAWVLGSPGKKTLAMPTLHGREKPQAVIEHAQVIEDRQLEAYVHARGIPLDLARMYLQEVSYRVGDHRFRALGFPNDAGGFEVRSPSFKGTLGGKDIRFLQANHSPQAAVFEGFFDFLSVLAHYWKDRTEANVLVLNSTALLSRGIGRLQAAEVKKLYTYLDHDLTGEKALSVLQAAPGWQVLDASGLYTGFKDANDFWMWMVDRQQRKGRGGLSQSR